MRQPLSEISPCASFLADRTPSGKSPENRSDRVLKVVARRLRSVVRLSLLWAAAGHLLWANPSETATTADQLRPWSDYRVIMWIGDTAAKHPEKLSQFYDRLREMGVNAAMVYGGGDPASLVQNKFPYYVENIVNRGLCLKFNSQVRDWDKVVTDWAKGGRPESALVRDYSLDDTDWRRWARTEVQAVVRRNRENGPLAYDLRDELSTTISANPFDYDFSPTALSGFRAWLKTQYADVGQLNAEWETQFANWDAVRPFTTDQTKNRMASGDALPRGRPDWQAVQQVKFNAATARQEPTRWNFAPWADFRSYMDLSLARALDDLRNAAHEADPATPVGIEGTQMPAAFGGYDLWRMSQALDWCEPYDIGNSREILGSFMEGKPLITTVFEKDTHHAMRRLWHLLLEGDRGCIVWWSEDCVDWKNGGFELNAKSKALAPAFAEMTSPLARLFLRAKREYDPIFIHYSQPSIQADWLIESTVDGSTWLRRFSSFEADHNRQAKVRDGWLKLFQDLGYTPRFVSSEQLADVLKAHSAGALVLPNSYALSDFESSAISRWLADARRSSAVRVFADGEPGLFDEHGRLRKQPPLESIFPAANSNERCYVASDANRAAGSQPGDISRYPVERLRSQGSTWLDWASREMQSIPREVAVSPASHTSVRRYGLGNARLVAFERNIDYHMSEDLKQSGGNEALESPIEIDATLAKPVFVYNLRTQEFLGRVDKIHLTLDPWQPSLFALTPSKLPEGSVISALEKEVQP